MLSTNLKIYKKYMCCCYEIFITDFWKTYGKMMVALEINIFWKKIGIHSMQGWTSKDEKHRKNQRKKCIVTLDYKPFSS